MKKLDKMMHELDESVDHVVEPVWRRLHKYFALFSSTVLLLLFGLFVFRIFNSRSDVMASMMAEDLERIERALALIDKRCNILDVRPESAVIDFLTVTKFTGSTVGSLNLAHPKKWQGPYCKQNPTIQDHFYEIVRAKDGYYIVPGHGVTLPNKLVMGADIVITPEVGVAAMLQPGGRLNHQGEMLAVRLPFTIGDWDPPHLEKDSVEKINDMIKEFNEAMPFAQRAEPFKTINC